MNSWYCKKYDRTINIKSKPKHLNSNSQKHKENIVSLLKYINLIIQTLVRLLFIIDNCAKDCYNKRSHRFKFRCINSIEMINGDFVSGMISGKNLNNIIREKGFLHKLKKNLFEPIKYR